MPSVDVSVVVFVVVVVVESFPCSAWLLLVFSAEFLSASPFTGAFVSVLFVSVVEFVLLFVVLFTSLFEDDSSFVVDLLFSEFAVLFASVCCDLSTLLFAFVVF